MLSIVRRGRPADAWNVLVNTLGGIAAEILVFGNFWSGATETDLLRARELADSLRAQAFRPDGARRGPGPALLDFGKMFRSEVHPETLFLLGEAYMKARGILSTNDDRLRALTLLLIRHSEVTEAMLEETLGSRASIRLVGTLGVTRFLLRD